MHEPSESNPLILTNIFLQSTFSVAESLAITWLTALQVTSIQPASISTLGNLF